MGSADVVIAGGGIIGLSSALELAQHGYRVRVLERGHSMAEASWAAAGMLAAEDPENPPELAELSALSRSLYPEYLAAVARLSGLTIPLRTHNALQATRPGGVFDCPQTASRAFVTAEEARARVPSLITRDRSFLWLNESSLDPREICAALPRAAIAAGVVVEEKTEVSSLKPGSASVEIATTNGTVSAGSFVNCCGAWASSVTLPGDPAAGLSAAKAMDQIGGINRTESRMESRVEPRKGQMVMVRMEGSPKLQYVLRTPDFYLVPRGDGRIVIGATVERSGFDRRVDRAALDGLIAQAAGLWPPVASAPVVERWTGLRPGTPDDLPLIGPAAASRCWLATGHFRNGILLAPATALVLRQLIEGKPPAVGLRAFSAHRPARV